MTQTRTMSAAADMMMIHAADRFYVQRDWRSALPMYRVVAERNPGLADEFALALCIGHCAVELDDDAPLPALSRTGAKREEAFLNDVRTRAYEICRAGDFTRAVRLLRFIAGACPLVGTVYREGLLDGRSAPAPVASQPPFLRELLPDATVAALRQRHAGARILLVVRRFHFNSVDHQHDMVDVLHRGALGFGLTVGEFNSHWQPGGTPDEAFPARLMEAIDTFRPDILWFDDLFETGLSASSESQRDQLSTVLATARQRYGTRVIKAFPDAWMVPVERFHRGIGDCVDLVYHFHPAVLPRATEAERARTFCFPLPYQVAAPTVPAGGIPRAAFMGTIYSFNYSRIVWWAETMARGLPIDFMPWLPSDWGAGKVPKSDTDYTNALQGYRVSINLTRRSSGTKILIGRTLETLIAGGVLVEEDSFDAAYFLQPGVHYTPFKTLDDLADVVGTLLDDEAARTRLRTDGQAWVRRYFAGDQFWAGLLSRLYA